MTIKQTRQSALTRQIARLERRLAALNRRNDRFMMLRLVIILVGLPAVVVTFFFTIPVLFWLSLAATISSFSVAVYYHRQVRGSIQRHAIWQRIKQTHLARMTLDWAQIPIPPVQIVERTSLVLDLDLRQLHRLIDTATSNESSQRLYHWLITRRPDASVIQERQALVHELIPLTTFRDRLTLYATPVEDSRGGHDSQQAANWLADARPPGRLRSMLAILVVLAVINILVSGLSALDAIPAIGGITWALYIVLYLTQWRTIRRLSGEVRRMTDALETLGTVMGYVERYPDSRHPHLHRLCAPLVTDRPSKHLQRARRTLSAASLQGNLYIWLLLNAVVPWDLYFIDQLYRQKAQLARQLPAWLDVWHELETLASLATFAALNPEYTFPKIAGDAGSVFQATQIGHPLIPEATRVCNDLTLDQPGEVVLITGSNMAGKSSFLRTLGVNLCLAYAGSVVNAESLETRLFRLHSCIRIRDSLDDGISYFYAEVKCLRKLLDELQCADSLPLFYVIDEIFRGTNNRERLIGSRAYIEALIGQRGVGLIATHDLELVRLADQQVAILNYHFREEVIEGRMVFDYRLRPGPCPTTNALKIMQMEGLPVEPSDGV